MRYTTDTYPATGEGARDDGRRREDERKRDQTGEMTNRARAWDIMIDTRMKAKIYEQTDRQADGRWADRQWRTKGDSVTTRARGTDSS